MVLCPIGVFLTYKANKDSVLFNTEAYMNIIRKIFCLRISRHISRKEVIIHDPDYPSVKTELGALCEEWNNYAQKTRLISPPNYLKLFFRNSIDETAVKLNERYEELISILSNSRDLAILDTLNSLPVISPNAHTRPFHDYRLNMAVGIIFPIGLFFLIRIWIYRLRLYKDIQQIQKCSAGIIARIDKLNQASQ